MNAEDGLVQGIQEPTRSYRRRWIIVIVTMLFNVGAAFGKAYFGQINDVYATYFQISLTKIDWLTLAPAASALTACILLSWISTTADVGLRKWCLSQCGILALAYAILAAACLSRAFFPLALVAQFLLGIPGAIGLVSTSMVAVTWFPPTEVGIAMAIHFAGYSAGLCLGFFIPGRVLEVSVHHQDVELMLELTKMRSIYLFSSASAFFILLFAITYVIVRNQPHVPPSPSELKKRKCSKSSIKQENAVRTITGTVLSEILAGMRLLASDRDMRMIFCSFGLSFSNDCILFALLSDIVAARGGNLISIGSPEVVSGLAMTIFGLSHLFSGIIAGKLIVHAQELKTYICLFYFCQFMSTVTIACGVYLANFIILCVGMGLFGFGTTSSILSLMELGCQHMFPTNEILVTSWLVMFGQTLGLTTPLLFRQILDKCGYKPAVCLESALLGVGFIVLLLTRPKYRRATVNSIGETNA